MIKRMYRFVLSDYLLRNSAILAMGAVGTGGLNYLFQLFSARVLTVEEYGVLGAFTAIFSMITYSGQAVSFWTTKNVVLAKSDEQRSSVLWYQMRLFGLIGLLGTLAYLALGPWVKQFLKVDATSLILLSGVVMFTTLIHMVLQGFGRGMEDFSHPTISNVVSALVKLLVGLGLVMLGMSVGGAIIGIALGTVVAIGYLLYQYRRFLQKSEGMKLSSRKEFLWYLAILSASVLFIHVDMLLVKFYFSDYDAGLYAAASLMGKMVLFLGGATMPVMFPRIVQKVEQGDWTETRRLFWRTMGLSMLFGGALVIIFALAPKLSVGIMYGAKYPVQDLVIYNGIFVLLYVALSIIVALALAMKRYTVLVALAVGGLLQLGLVTWRHATLAQVLIMSIVAIAASIVLCAALVFLVPLKAAKK